VSWRAWAGGGKGATRFHASCRAVFFVPVTQAVLAPLGCGDKGGAYYDLWQDFGAACGSSGMLVAVLMTSLIALLLWAQTLLYEATAVDANPLSDSLHAKVHGRADVVVIAVQGVLVVVVHVLRTRLAPWLVLAACAAGAVAWLAAYVGFLPHFNARTNVGNVVGAAINCWFVVALIIATTAPSTFNIGILMLTGLPFAGLAGWALIQWRVYYVLHTPLNRIATSYCVELKVRHLLYSIIFDDSELKRLKAVGGAGKDRTAAGKRGRAAVASSSASANGDGNGGGSGNDDEGDRGSVTSSSTTSLDGAERMAALRNRVPPELLEEILKLYRLAAARFRGSALMHVFISRYFAVFMVNRHMQLAHLLQADKRNPALDVSFFIHTGRKQAEEAMNAAQTQASGSTSLASANRVGFEVLLAEARRYVAKGAGAQLAFSAELADACPDITRMHNLATEVSTALVNAEK
jgi:hypothetical protein